MTCVKLTSADFKDGEYIGDIDFTKKFEGSIGIAASLGTMRFKRLWVSGFIRAGSGTGISAGEGISAGWEISAGEVFFDERGVICDECIEAMVWVAEVERNGGL